MTLRRSSGFRYWVGEVLVVAMWFGVVGGLLEGAAHWIYQITPVLSYGERFHPVDLNTLWTSPLVDIFLFGMIACVLLPALWILRKRDWRFEIIVFTALICNALLVGTGRIRMGGAVVLAVGLGTVASHWMNRAAMAFLRRSLIPLLCIALLTFAAVQMGDSIWEKAQIARLPAAPPNAPNVLLIVLDTLRADRLSAYGYGRPTTPFLDEYARRGVLFERAFANSSWTMPSHTSLFTGRFPFQHGVDLWNYDGRFATLAQVMAARGYATVGFSANEWPCTRASGLGVGFIKCESIYNGPLDTFLRTFYGRRLAASANNYYDEVDEWGRPSAEEINGRFLGWLDRRPTKPFFAFLNYMEAHGPYHPLRLQPGREQIIPAAYEGKVTHLDEQLRNLFDQLRSRGLDKNLLVIITADHGQSLGEHGLFGHRSSLYLDQIHVPLLMVWPGKIPAGLRVSDVVGLQAVPGTIGELASLGRNVFPGGSLTGCWTGGACGDESVLSELSFPESRSGKSLRPIWIKSLITSRRHFILEQNGQVELYDWPSDPREARNLADSPEERSAIETLGTKLAEMVPQAAAAWAVYTGKTRAATRQSLTHGTEDVRE